MLLKRNLNVAILNLFSLILIFYPLDFEDINNVTSKTLFANNQLSAEGKPLLSTKNYNVYDFNNAPESVKSRILVHNKIVPESIKIFVAKDNITNRDTNAKNQLFYFHNSTTGQIQAFKDNSVYYVYTSDYIGYGHITYGQKVAAAQIVLSIESYPIGIDSAFGEETYGSITYFQRKVHIPDDGIIGPITWSYLVK